MKRRKRVGERTQPCGTPAFTSCKEEVTPSTRTQKDLLYKKEEIRLQVLGGMPKDGSLDSNLSCHTLSKAFEISTEIAQDSP